MNETNSELQQVWGIPAKLVIEAETEDEAFEIAAYLSGHLDGHIHPDDRLGMAGLVLTGQPKQVRA